MEKEGGWDENIGDSLCKRGRVLKSNCYMCVRVSVCEREGVCVSECVCVCLCVKERV